MLQAIINGQSSLKQELVTKIDKLDVKLSNKIDNVEDQLNKVEKNLTNRIDALGKQMAYLEDDTPTREEFDKLENRVDKIEQKVVPV